MQMTAIVGTIKVSGKRLLHLINDVLDAAKMKQGKLIIMHEKVCACVCGGGVRGHDEAWQAGHQA